MYVYTHIHIYVYTSIWINTLYIKQTTQTYICVCVYRVSKEVTFGQGALSTFPLVNCFGIAQT